MHVQGLDEHKQAFVISKICNSEAKQYIATVTGSSCSLQDLLLAGVEADDEQLVITLLLSDKKFFKNNSLFSSQLLHNALQKKSKSLVHVLLQHKADVFVSDCFGCTTLHSAVRIGFFSTVKRLLNLGVDVNVRDDYGRTPMHYAVQGEFWGNSCMAGALCLLGYEIDITLRDSDGNTPFGLARKYACKNFIDLFESFDCYCKAFIVNPFQSFIAIEDGQVELPAWLCFKMLYLNENYSDELGEVVNILLKKNPDQLKCFMQKCKFDTCSKPEIRQLQERKLPLIAADYPLLTKL
jgi:hypothetical protein